MIVMPTFFQALDKKSPKDKLFRFSFHFFNLFFYRFITVLSVILQLDKGDYPENLQTVCLCISVLLINKRSFDK